MNYLGLDYGTKKTGVALATGPLAEPLTTVPTAAAPRTIPRLIREHRIQALIVGLPEGPVRQEVENFVIHKLDIGIPVHLVDESLSSKDAVFSLLHTTPRRRHLKEHAAAAAIILQSWLDSQTAI